MNDGFPWEKEVEAPKHRRSIKSKDVIDPWREAFVDHILSGGTKETFVLPEHLKVKKTIRRKRKVVNYAEKS